MQFRKRQQKNVKTICLAASVMYAAVIVPLLTMLVHKWGGRLALVLKLISYERIMPLTCSGGFHVSLTSTV